MANKSKKAFLEATNKKGLTAVKTVVRFPFQYHEGFEAFTVDVEGMRLYFCFGSDNQLISKQLITKWN